MKVSELNVGDKVHFMWSNGLIYKGKVYDKKKTEITIENIEPDGCYMRRFIKFSIKTGIVKDESGFNGYLVLDMPTKQIIRHNRDVRRKISMRSLEFRGGELLFDNTPINKLNSVQQGMLEDMVAEYPNYDELADLEAKANLIDDIANMYKEIRKEREKWLEDENRYDDKEGRQLGDAMMSKIYSLFEDADLDTMLDED